MIRARLRCCYIAVLCRKFRYLLFFVGCVFLLPYTFYSPLKKLIHGHNVNSSVNLKYVMVHFDLKGAPPKLTYLADMLHTLSMYGVNSILMEYEDMFPYEGTIVNVSSEYCYKKDELRMFLNTAKSLNIEIIPLVQTFGHMEHALKLQEFAHLRENQKYPSEICPSNNLSTILISGMLSQVIKFHATIFPLRHIHIGCDEVYHINTCPRCRGRNLKNTALFLQHVEAVSAIVTRLSPNTKVLIWADMLASTKKQSQMTLIDNVESVMWEYGFKTKSRMYHTELFNLHKQFNNIWIASAFKGADGIDATLPDIKRRFENNLEWMKLILDYKFGGETKIYNFKGIILTGWSRYFHLAVHCELFPTSMPSLVLNLLLIKTVREGIHHGDLQNMDTCDFFNKYLKSDFEMIFQCYRGPDETCSFENTILYREYNKMFDSTLHQDCLSGLRPFELQYYFDKYSIDVYSLETNIKTCQYALQNLVTVRKKLISFMSKYYSNEVIKSYLNEKVYFPEQNIKRIMNNLKNYSEIIPYWKRRH